MYKNSIVIMALTLVSRILGLIRTVLIATFFGATGLTDAYFSAFKITNFFRQLLGEGALGTVFIPVYNEKETKEGKKEAKELIFSIMNLLFIFLVAMSFFMMIFSKNIINTLVSGYDEETKRLASSILKITSWYFLFIGLAGMISAILNNFKKFYMPAFMPMMFNFSIIGFIIFLYKKLGIYALAYGTLVGGALQLIVLIPSFVKIIKKYKFHINFKDKYLKKIFVLILPMLLGIFAKQINTIIDQYFASYLPNGTISALENATRVYNLPIGIFAISIATVTFPSISKAAAKKDMIKIKSEMEKGLKFLIFFVIPSFWVLIFYSTEIIDLLLGYGKFSERAIVLTSESLLFYSIGLFSYTAIHLFTRGFYSMKNTKSPVIFAVVAIIVNIALDYLLVDILQHRGLALATATASTVNFVLLYTFFNIKYIKLNLKQILTFSFYINITAILSLIISKKIGIHIIIQLIAYVISYFSIWGYKLLKEREEFFER
ncbi:MAG: murein biosynthesis integral membrane protein MurJ [Fusobacteriota bacterium]